MSAFEKNYTEAIIQYGPMKEAVLAYKNDHAERANRIAALEAQETQLFIDIQKYWIDFKQYTKSNHLTAAHKSMLIGV